MDPLLVLAAGFWSQLYTKWIYRSFKKLHPSSKQ